MNYKANCYYFGVILLFTSVYGQDFGYDGHLGPTHWGEYYTSCLGKFQSPINIDSALVTRIHLPPLMLQGFKRTPGEITVTNNGHTLMLTVDAEKQPTISGGPLQEPYEFTQMHFHWGESDDEGSEDQLDGLRFPMELHMVFFKKRYRTVRAAMDHDDGLTVLAFFYEVSKTENPKYTTILSHVAEVNQPKTSINIQDNTSFADLIPTELLSYYTYKGSLTTPPCSEIVTWVDFKTPIPLSHAQLEAFRSIYDSHGHLLTHNFRPVQDLGERTVFYVSTEHENDSEFKFISSSPRPQSDIEYTTDVDETTQPKVIDQNDNVLDEGTTEVVTKSPKSRPHFGNHAQMIETPMLTVLLVCGLLSVYISANS